MQHGDFSPAMLQCRKCLAAYGTLQSPLAPVLEVTAPQVEEQEEEWAPPSPAQPSPEEGVACSVDSRVQASDREVVGVLLYFENTFEPSVTELIFTFLFISFCSVTLKQEFIFLFVFLQSSSMLHSYPSGHCRQINIQNRFFFQLPEYLAGWITSLRKQTKK